jgi:hypothetical protein
MATKVYGASDDLIEFEGDVVGEVGAYAASEKAGMLLVFDDGTQAVVKYGKPGDLAIWSITLLAKGALFDRIDVCLEETADGYSDVLYFKDGLKSALAARIWEKVQ